MPAVMATEGSRGGELIPAGWTGRSRNLELDAVKQQDPSALPMVVAVCAYRLDNVARHLDHNIAQLKDEEYLVVLDRPHSAQAEQVADRVRSAGGEMRILGATNGLSASRNSVLRRFPHRHVLFIDDDVRLDAEAVGAARDGFRSGAHILGARLHKPPELNRLPWYISSGQFHLVGWHSAYREIKIWGACMGVDTSFATRHGLDFDLGLSRSGDNLRSGEDTTFVRLVKAAGGRERLLSDAAVVHDIDRGRLTPGYLLRRAYWQGRSEVLRDQTRQGLHKEWDRHIYAPDSRLTWMLACLYGSATVLGAAHQKLLSLGGARSR